MKKQNPLVNWFLNSAVGMMLTNSMQRQTTGIQRNGRVTTKCDNLPRDYPGAKLARKAAQRRVTLKHSGIVGNQYAK